MTFALRPAQQQRHHDLEHAHRPSGYRMIGSNAQGATPEDASPKRLPGAPARPGR